MIRRPPRSTRTDTLFPYTTLFRSLAISIRTWPRLRMQRSPKSKKSYLPASLTPITSIHTAFLSTGSYDPESVRGGLRISRPVAGSLKNDEWKDPRRVGLVCATRTEQRGIRKYRSDERDVGEEGGRTRR